MPVDGEVREAGVVAEALAHRLAHGVQGRGVDRGDAPAAVAHEVLAIGAAGEGVQAGTVAEVDVADHPEALQALEVAVDGGELQRRDTAVEAARDLVGRDGAVGGEERLEHGARRRRHAVAVLRSALVTSRMFAKGSGVRSGASVIPAPCCSAPRRHGELACRPGVDRVEATYLLTARGPVEHAAEVLAGEQSTGTFVALPDEDDALKDRFRSRVEAIEPLGGGRARVRVSLPAEQAGGDLTTLLAALAGNVTEIAEATGVRLLEIRVPESFALACPRPRGGVAGLRAATGVAGRPLRTGADLVLDGIDVTGEAGAMLERAERIAAAGGRVVSVGLPQAGIAGVVARAATPSCSSRAGVPARACSPRSAGFGWAPAAEALVWRLAGVDALCAGPWEDAAGFVQACLTPIAGDDDRALPVLAGPAPPGVVDVAVPA